MKRGKPKFKLSRHERIIAVVPEQCAGPGWTNKPTWIYIEDSSNKRLRTECIQPEEMPPSLAALFDVGMVVNRALIDSVSELFINEE